MATSTIQAPPGATPRAKPSGLVEATNAAVTSAVKTSFQTNMSNIWEQVIKDNLAKLSAADRQLCVALPCHAVIDHASLEAAFGPIRDKYQSGKFHKFLEKINPIFEHVLSFGRAIDVAVGGGDLGAGLVWGGIRILLAVSTRTMSLQDKIIEHLDILASYLPLFERWTKLFHPNDYTELAACIRITCSEFFNYLVLSIRFFRKSALVNFFQVVFKPTKLEGQFRTCQERIKRQTKHLSIEVSTAGLEDSKKRDTSIMALIQASSSTAITNLIVNFPLRFIQNAPRNDQFFAREDILMYVNAQLCPQAGGQRMRSVVIYGLGGSGKSSIAKEYMYREYNAGRFEVIIWLYADAKDKLETQFIDLARHIGIKTVESEARHSVLCWINNLGKEFLLVFDNADDPTFLRPYWPNTTCGSVLVTSRNPKTQEEGFAHTGIPLKAFENSEGSNFLRTMLPTAFQTSQEDDQAITVLSQRFGGLPLALRQAGSFMKNKNCHPTRFLRMYEQKFEDIDGYPVEGHDKTVATTWTVSTGALTEDSRILLDAFSLLDPDSIPAEMFDVIDFRSSYAKFLEDQLETANAQEGLTQQSLVDYDYNSKSLSIHRHLQHITFTRLRRDLRRLQHTANLVLHLLDKYIPDIGFTAVRHPHHWRYVEKTLSHIRCIHGRCDASNYLVEGANSKMLACLTKVLCYAFESAQYPLGEWAYEQGVALSKNISKPDHEVLSLMYLLFGRLCGEMSRAQEGLAASIQAEKHILIAAKIKPGLLKTGQYSRILTNLGIMHTDLGNWDEALKWHNRAVENCIQLGKQEEFSLGNLRQNLAGTYLWKGDLQMAEGIVRLALTEPNTSPMGATFTLGNVLWKQKRIEEALEVHKQTLLEYSASLGASHPVTANSWLKMGTLLQNPGHPGFDLKESEQCFRKAYDIWKAQAAKHNNDSDMYLARAKCWLGHVLEQLGPCHTDECVKLKGEAREFLLVHFRGNVPADRSMTALFEELAFYWDR